MAKGKKTGGRDFKPGQSGNPAGYPGLPKDIRDARKLGQIELERTVNRLIYMTSDELTAVITDTSVPMFDKILAQILCQASDKGDQARLDFILNRVVGKVQDRVEVTTPKPFIIERRDGSQIELGAKIESEDDE